MTESIRITVNGDEKTPTIEPRLLLSDVLRDELNLTGTKRGCDTGKCGACTVLLDGNPIKSCNVLALQVEGKEITTIEGVSSDGELTAVQRAFWDELSFQCGYCTPGMIMSIQSLLENHPNPTEEQIRSSISGNICRCTGYVNIINGVMKAAEATDGDSD